MKNLRSIVSGLLATIIMLSLFTSGYAAPGSRSDSGAPITAVPSATLRAASGARILFRAQDGPVVQGVSLEGWEVPHLVLRRNGALTDPDERTLVVEVTGIEVPPPGVTVTLHVETQHGDPDPPAGAASDTVDGDASLPSIAGGDASLPSIVGGDASLPSIVGGGSNRIPVWRESRWIANTSRVTRTSATATFTHTFHDTVISGTETIATPTDYFRTDVAVIDASHPITNPLHTLSADHAFLMESQWIAPLPEVQEASPGAAPDELIVYYCDMFPFQKSIRDPATWLAREDVPDYVQSELVPQMVEAFRVQTDEWGFPWYRAWTSYRLGEDAERLSVALSDGRTWFHSRAPLRGHAGISIKVTGGDNAAYDTLTDGLIASFHHELFHNHQRNISQHRGRSIDIDGEDGAWQFFSEGTAVLASSVGQPDPQFTSVERAYMANANGFMGGGGLLTDLNRSYERMIPYHGAIYWRFLYEQCGGTKDGAPDPAAGMQVIRRALTILYSRRVVDITASTDLVGALPEIMDRALSGSPCPFDTHAESLAAFARALYALRLEDGRCAAPGTPAGCGFYDPENLYYGPPLSMVSYSGADQQHVGEIPSSFGVDFVEVVLDPAADGRPLTLEFHGAPGADAAFTMQVWELKEPRVDSGDSTRPRRVPDQVVAPEALARANSDGRLFYATPAIDMAAHNRLGLVITRVDANEHLDPAGEYTIVLRPAEPDALATTLHEP